MAYALVDDPIGTFPQTTDLAPTTGLTTYTNGTELPAITAGKYLRIYEIDDSTGLVVKFQEKTLVASEIKTPDFPMDQLAKGTAGDSTKVTGLNAQNPANTFAWVLDNSSLATPDIGSTPESGLTTYTNGSNIPAVTVGKYLRLYELDSNGKVVKFEEKTLTAPEIKTPDFATDTLAKGTAGGSTIISGVTPKDPANTLKWVVSPTHLDEPNIGTTMAESGTTYINGATVPNVKVGQYLRLYEVDSNGHIVSFEERVLTLADIKALNNTQPIIDLMQAQVQTHDQPVREKMQQSVIMTQALPNTVQIIDAKGFVVDADGMGVNGGAMQVQDGKSMLTMVAVSNANPFNTNENISVLNGGIKVASLDLPAGILADVKLISPVIIAPVKQGNVELAQGSSGNLNARLIPNDTNMFTFTVKEAVASILGIKDVADAKATLKDGKALPNWLKFDKTTQTFSAKNPPEGELPLTAKVQIVGKDGKTASMNVEVIK